MRSLEKIWELPKTFEGHSKTIENVQRWIKAHEEVEEHRKILAEATSKDDPPNTTPKITRQTTYKGKKTQIATQDENWVDLTAKYSGTGAKRLGDMVYVGVSLFSIISSDTSYWP